MGAAGGGRGRGAAGTLYGKHVVPVGNVIQGKASSLDKIFTVTNPGGLGQSLAVSLELWKISEYEWEKMCGLVEYQDKLRNQAKIHLLPVAAQAPFNLGAQVKRTTFLERRDLYLLMRYMLICSSRPQQPWDTIKGIFTGCISPFLFPPQIFQVCHISTQMVPLPGISIPAPCFSS